MTAQLINAVTELPVGLIVWLVGHWDAPVSQRSWVQVQFRPEFCQALIL